jgi:hypothetical protein
MQVRPEKGQTMQDAGDSPRTSGRECARCGHAESFHEEEPPAAQAGAERKTICTSPEDGTACTCEGFEPI